MAEKQHIDKYNFQMHSSTDISFDLIREAEKTIDRLVAFDKINIYVKNIAISSEVEKGLFEASLLHNTMKNLDNSLVSSVYKYKLYSICRNLDINDKFINNLTLLDAIRNGELKPQLIAFLSPQQMHAKRWESVIQKKMREDDAMYNIPTTDEYECPKCFERKAIVDYVQLRSADEPANKFITCVVCCYTVIL